MQIVGQPFEIELDLGQWQPICRARQRQFPDQRPQRIVLVFIGVQHLLANAAQVVGEGRVPVSSCRGSAGN